MQSIKLLHIGDVHYPERNDDDPADIKDSAIDSTFVDLISPTPLKTVADDLRRRLLDDTAVKGVLVSGDLTTRGDIVGYTECVDYLRHVLSLDEPAVWKDRILAVVPGNHDVDRLEVDDTGHDYFRKFSKATDIWQKIVPGTFSPSTVQFSDIPLQGNAVVRLAAVNTCVGCGERRHLPDKIREEFSKILASACATMPPKDAFDLIGERLDTPAILEDHVKEIETQLRTQPSPAVAVVLGHHALLPQARLRVDLYTELLNAGRFRSSLATLNTTALYCHGHLHEDPIEVVLHPSQPKGRLVAISAPLFKHGFNTIELVFTDDGHPLGCRIHLHRLTPFGSIRDEQPVRVRFQTDGHSGSLCDETSLTVLKALGKKALRFGELAEKVSTVSAATLIECVKLLDWLSLIHINGADDDPVYWHLRRISP